jgi:hypothetical protein
VGGDIRGCAANVDRILAAFDGLVPAVSILFPVTLSVAAISVMARNRRPDTPLTLHDPAIDALLVYSALFVGYLVFSPQPESPLRVRLEPGDDLWTALGAAPGDPLPWVQLVGNLALLLPLGVLVPLRVPWFDAFGKIAIGGVLTACTIEMIQFLLISGRVASTDDVVLNSMGVLIGGLIVRAPWQRQVAVRQPVAQSPRDISPQDTGVRDVLVVTPGRHDEAHDRHTVWRLIARIEAEHPRRVPARLIGTRAIRMTAGAPGIPNAGRGRVDRVRTATATTSSVR